MPPTPIYTSLDPSLQEIRLLDLAPGARGAPLACTTRTTALPSKPLYTALSYTWGPPQPSVRITFNAHPSIAITANLAAALRQLRHPTDTVVLWVDALCINQQDVVEKSSQIQYMREIYSQAAQTVIWLGEEAEDSGHAMEVIGRLDGEDPGSEKNVIDDRGLRAIGALQERTWWERIWVIQEALLSQHAIVKCGPASLPLSSFITLDDLRRGWHRSTSTWVDHIPHANLIRNNPFSAILTSFDTDRARIATHTSALGSWLIDTDSFRATEPRDKIYGLLGLVSPRAGSPKLVPDYSKSVAEVYAEAVVYAIESHGALLSLCFDQDNKSMAFGLPSWVQNFDFDPLRRSYVFLRQQEACQGLCWGESQLHAAALSRDGWRLLSIRGLRFQRVAWVGRNPYLAPYKGYDPVERMDNVKARAAQTLSNIKAWEMRYNSHPQNPYGDAQTKAEAFWRTLMANSTIQYSEVPAGQQNQYFETWLGRGSVPAESRASNPELDEEEILRVYVKPFTDSAITRCHGRAFVITDTGHCGLVPFKTQVGDVVYVLEGGGVPFVLRPLSNGGESEGEGRKRERFNFVGEGYVHGIMKGEWAAGAKQSDIENLIIE